MPAWFETLEEIKAAFIGHITTKGAGGYACSKAKLVPIHGSENAPLGRVASMLQSVCEAHSLPVKVEPVPSALIQTPDSKCGHS